MRTTRLITLSKYPERCWKIERHVAGEMFLLSLISDKKSEKEKKLLPAFKNLSKCFFTRWLPQVYMLATVCFPNPFLILLYVQVIPLFLPQELHCHLERSLIDSVGDPTLKKVSSKQKIIANTQTEIWQLFRNLYAREKASAKGKSASFFMETFYSIYLYNSVFWWEFFVEM